MLSSCLNESRKNSEDDSGDGEGGGASGVVAAGDGPRAVVGGVLAFTDFLGAVVAVVSAGAVLGVPLFVEVVSARGVLGAVAELEGLPFTLDVGGIAIARSEGGEAVAGGVVTCLGNGEVATIEAVSVDRSRDGEDEESSKSEDGSLEHFFLIDGLGEDKNIF